MTTNQMRHIYNKFVHAGINASYIRKMLPEWWDDRLAETPSGRQYASLHLARMFNILPDSLKDGSDSVCFNFGGNHKYKHRQNVAVDDLDVATAIAYSAARIVSSNFNNHYSADISLNAGHVREYLMKSSPWVSLSNLVGFCHSIGIPVIFLKNFPQGAKKMAGLALMSGGRPVIVLTQPKKYGYMLFDLAHELGHIALGHLNEENGHRHVDEKIESDSTNDIEKEANEYAFEILSGQKQLNIVPTNGFLIAENLAIKSIEFGKGKGIDPTHVALNYGHGLGHWGVAVNAVKHICKDTPTDQDFLRAMMRTAINPESVDEDDLCFLEGLIKE